MTKNKKLEKLVELIKIGEKFIARQESIKAKLEGKVFRSSVVPHAQKVEKRNNSLKKRNKIIRKCQVFMKKNELKIKKIKLEAELKKLDKEITDLSGWCFHPVNYVTLHNEYELVEEDGENMKTRRKQRTKN